MPEEEEERRDEREVERQAGGRRRRRSGPFERLGRRIDGSGGAVSGLMGRIGGFFKALGGSVKLSENTEALAKWLAGAALVVTGLLGFLGTAGPELDRLLRNEPTAFRNSLIWVGIAIGIGLVAPLLFGLRVTALLLLVGVVCLGVGLLGMAELAIENKAAKERPRVTAKLVSDEQGTWIEADVSARGLKSTEHVFVRIEGRSTRTRLARWHAGTPSDWNDITAWQRAGDVDEPSETEQTIDYYQLLYATRIGADPEGKISLPIRVRVSPGLYERAVVSAELISQTEDDADEQTRADVLRAALTDPDADDQEDGSGDSKAVSDAVAKEQLLERRCTSATRTWGCATVVFPAADRRPSLRVSWKGSGDASVLTVQATMAGLGADDQLALFVMGLRKVAGHGTALFRAFPVAGPVGDLAAAIEVPVPSVFQAVCVTAVAVPSAYGDPASLVRVSADGVVDDGSPTTEELDSLLALPRAPRGGCKLEGPRIGTLFVRRPGAFSKRARTTKRDP